MKTEFIDISDTRKNLVVEIPSAVVDAEIDRVAKDYSRAARIPGFRPGKVPPRVVRQRFRDQILHDVAHGLIPRAVDEALRDRGVEPVDTPDIRDVVVEEGQPLKFTAEFETVPPIDPGAYAGLALRKPPVEVDEDAVEQALNRLRERSARYVPVEDRGVEQGDTVQVDLERRTLHAGAAADEAGAGGGSPEKHENLSIDIGAAANPPGFDEPLTGLTVGAHKQFTVSYPDDYALKELAGSAVEYGVTLKAIKRRVVPELDDEFARDLGEFDNVAALGERVRNDLTQEAGRAADRQVRADLLRQLASRVSFEVPSTLVDHEVDRRVEEFVRRLLEQQIDPTRTNIDWEEFRTAQREPATEAVKSALVLDEVARRESLTSDDEDIRQEVERYAEQTGRSPAAVRARLEKEGAIRRLGTGVRREKAIDFLLARATMVGT